MQVKSYLKQLCTKSGFEQWLSASATVSKGGFGNYSIAFNKIKR